MTGIGWDGWRGAGIAEIAVGVNNKIGDIAEIGKSSSFTTEARRHGEKPKSGDLLIGRSRDQEAQRQRKPTPNWDEWDRMG